MDKELLTFNSLYTQVEELHPSKPYPDPVKKKLLEEDLNYQVYIKESKQALKKAIIRFQADLSAPRLRIAIQRRIKWQNLIFLR